MPEAGGPTTQSGIIYQNSIAALYLGRLLDLRPSSRSSGRIVAVRVEAPEHVDDVVVGHVDGAKTFIQAKENLSLSGAVWDKLWSAIKLQAQACQHSGDAIHIVIGTLSAPVNQLAETVARAQGKLNYGEWINALNNEQKAIASAISYSVDAHTGSVFDIVNRTTVVLWPREYIEDTLVRDWLPTTNVTPTALLSQLRDLCGAGARVRKEFTALGLAEILSRDYNVKLLGAQGEMVERYRQAVIAEFSHIAVPGTGILAAESQLLVNPTIRSWEGSGTADFEDEHFHRRASHHHSNIDLRNFTNSEMKTIVLESGAGYGKTTLLRATARRLASASSAIPALIAADALLGYTSLIEYLDQFGNASYDVNVNWAALAEVGRLAVLIDGIDEVDDTERVHVLKTISRAAARYPMMAILVAARDAAITILPPAFKRYRLDPLDDNQRHRMLHAYLSTRPELNRRAVLQHVHAYPELTRLASIPLFLAIFVATLTPKGPVPTSRTDLLEQYLEIALSPERHKGTSASAIGIVDLRRSAEILALLALDRNENAIPTDEARGALVAETGALADSHLNALVRLGLLFRRGARIGFVIPTVHEYLAGSAIAKRGRLAGEDWRQQVYRRPWAQALQFAVERLPSAETALATQLTNEDDVFHTTARFVGRCIVNGATVSSEFRSRVGDLLISALAVSYNSATAYTIARLILDGFVKDSSSTLHQYLISSKYGVLRAEMLIAINDDALTLECLDAILASSDIRELWSPEWRDLLSRAQSKSLPSLIAAGKKIKPGSLSASVLAEVFYNFLERDAFDWRVVVSDVDLPAVVKLAAQFRLLPSEQVDLELLRTAAEQQQGHLLWHNFSTAFMRIEGWQDVIRKLSIESDFKIGSQIFLFLDANESSMVEGQIIDALFLELLRDESCSRSVRFAIADHLAERGHVDDTDIILTLLRDCSFVEAMAWAESVPYLDPQTVQAGLEVLHSREFTTADQTKLVATLATNATHTPVESTPDEMGRRPFTKSHLLPSYADTLAAWAGELSGGTVNTAQRAELLQAALLLRRPNVTGDVERFLRSYLHDVDIVAAEDWAWFFTLVRLLGETRETINADLLWLAIIKSWPHPLHTFVELFVEQVGEAAYPKFIEYWGHPQASRARSAIIGYFESNAPRLGLMVNLTEKGLEIMKV